MYGLYEQNSTNIKIKDFKEHIKIIQASDIHFVNPNNFEDELKGVLNLDDKQLSPIIQAMKIEKVAELYQNSNTNQKQKILRNLEPAKAAIILEGVFKWIF